MILISQGQENVIIVGTGIRNTDVEASLVVLKGFLLITQVDLLKREFADVDARGPGYILGQDQRSRLAVQVVVDLEGEIPDAGCRRSPRHYLIKQHRHIHGGERSALGNHEHVGKFGFCRQRSVEATPKTEAHDSAIIPGYTARFVGNAFKLTAARERTPVGIDRIGGGACRR